jgi:hypothetical protein
MDHINLNNVIDGMIATLKTNLDEHQKATTHLKTGKITETKSKDVTDAEGKVTKVDEQVERGITEVERKAYHDTIAKHGPYVAKWEQDVAALSRERTRFSSEASVALSIIADMTVRELAVHAMNSVLLAEKKIIHPEHLHGEGVTKLSLYPLFGTLPSFAKKAAEFAAKKAQEDKDNSLQVALKEAEKEFKRKYAASLAKKKAGAVVAPAAPAPAPVPAPAVAAEPVVEDDEADDENGDSKTSFRFYVGQVCKQIIKETPKYQVWTEAVAADPVKGTPEVPSTPVLDKNGQIKAMVRISTDIRDHLSDIVVDEIARISTLTQLTANDMNNKTISEEAILSAVKKLLVDGHTPVETVEITDVMVADPAVVKAEAEKKEAAKAAAKAAALAAGVEFKDFKYAKTYAKLEDYPQVPGRLAKRVVTFPTSGYHKLETEVRAKLAILEKEFDAKAEAAEAAKAAKAAVVPPAK